ncbi:F-box protein At3g07870-like [Papaver somniferum]|uniref:F-box protein At3g07870-like n=1 Tax=Papaver somniferum TaxID=3469 RepID=UPI000E6FDA84|nr:F-box protein At3g07870-like [Papaver somniferum]
MDSPDENSMEEEDSYDSYDWENPLNSEEEEERFNRKQETRADYEDNWEIDENDNFVPCKIKRTEVERKKHEYDKRVLLFDFWEKNKYFLQFDIMLDILSRLTAVEILTCKLVCKTWRRVISLTQFTDLQARRHNRLFLLDQQQQQQDHLNGAMSKVSFLLLTMEKSSPLCYLENDQIKYTYFLKRVNHPLSKKRANTCVLVGSCNGLLCFSFATTHNVDDPASIYNPITREFLYLPRFEIPYEFLEGTYKGGKSYLKCFMVNGFGYNPPTCEYKVVRIFYGNEQALGRVQVYTLGTRKQWRNKGEITYSLFRHGYCLSRGMHVDGFLYWLENKDRKIVAFDLGVEEFSLLPVPPCYTTTGLNSFQLQVIGGRLCVVKQTLGEGIDIWSFKKENSEWESMLKLKMDVRCLMNVYWPITLLRNGGVLLRFNNVLIRHDTKTATSKKFLDLHSDMHKKKVGPLPLVEAIPHINSFVSLKALDLNTKTRKKNEFDSDSD